MIAAPGAFLGWETWCAPVLGVQLLSLAAPILPHSATLQACMQLPEKWGDAFVLWLYWPDAAAPYPGCRASSCSTLVPNCLSCSGRCQRGKAAQPLPPSLHWWQLRKSSKTQPLSGGSDTPLCLCRLHTASVPHSRVGTRVLSTFLNQPAQAAPQW